MSDRGQPGRAMGRRQFLRGAALGLLSAATVPLLAACGGAAPPAAPATTTSATAPAASSSASSTLGTPRKGGTLTVSQSVDINTLHPWLGTLNVWKVIKTNIYDQLSYQDPTTFEFKPKLATSFEWTDNNTSLLVTLPNNVTFHNGDKLTADDVKFTLDSIRDPKVGSWLRGFIAPIKEVQVVDATHLKIKTDTVENQLIPAFAYIDISPKSLGTDLAKKNPVGSGPYKFTEWVPNDRVTLERNPNYWNKDKPGLLDTIVFKPVTELQTRISQLMAGNVDLVYDFSLQEAPRLQADKKLAVFVVPPADQMFVAYLNGRKPPFDKLEVRQAVAYALDREAFIKNFLAGLGRADNSPFTPSHWAFDPKTEKWYTYDLDKAGKLLEQAGYPKGKGLNFSFLVPSGYPEFKQLATMLQASFTTLGYSPRIEEVDIAQWASRLNQTKDFFAAPDYPPRGTADPALTYSAGLFFPPVEANYNGLKPDAIPGYMDALRKGATTLDQNVRKQAYTQVQELWLEHLPGPIFCHRSTVHAASPAVKGFVPHPAFQQSFADVWLEK